MTRLSECGMRAARRGWRRAGQPARTLAACVVAAFVGQALLATPAGGQERTAAPDSLPREPLVTVVASALTGTVIDAAGRPLLGAVVTAIGRPEYVLTNEKGNFRLGHLLPGPATFQVRRVGFTPAVFDLDLPEATVVEVKATLRPNIVTLSTIVVEGEARSLWLFKMGFYDRATKQALGYFYPPDEMVRRNLTSMESLLSEIPGVTLDRSGGSLIPYGRWTGTKPCRLNVWIDNMLSASGGEGLDVLVPGPLVRAVEIYPSATAVPDRYARPNNRCGALVIWTKGVVR